MKKKPEYVAAIDLGTSKTTCIICEIGIDNDLEVIGFGNVQANGLKKGVIINLEEAISSVKGAVEEAEMMSDVSIGTAFVGIAGTHVKSFNSTGASIVTGKHNEISHNDIYDVIEAAQTVSIPEDREIIHLIPMEFIVDRQGGITDPIGMIGSRLEVNVHIITGAISSVKNVISCLNKAGIEVRDIISNQLASAQAVVKKDERELGIATIDIGAGTTDIAVFVDGHLEYTSVLPLGGDHFTGDIAVGLRTSIKEAERLKIKYGDLMGFNQDKEITVNYSGVVNGKKKQTIQSRILTEILVPRAEEFLSIIYKEFRKSGYDKDINAGLVLTGGGALLKGFPDLAEETFNLPVRIGTPAEITGLSEVIDNPIFSSSVGILQYGILNIASNKKSPFIKKGSVKQAKDNIKEAFKNLFY